MSRAIGIAAAAALLFLAIPTLAEDYQGVKIVSVGKGQMVFEDKDGKPTNLYFSPALKIIDDKGEQQDPITGVRFLAKDNVIDIKTMVDKKQKREFVVEIKFVSGKVAELPKTGAKVDLKPDPNFKGKPTEIQSGDPVWNAYIKAAKVGDFTEYKSGNDQEPGRQETLEVGKDYVVVTRVDYLFGKRIEMRTKFKLPPPPKPGTKTFDNPFAKGPTGKKTSEELTIGGKKVACTKIDDGKIQTWTSADVPFDGLVKKDSRNYKFILTDFGRGKE